MKSRKVLFIVSLVVILVFFLINVSVFPKFWQHQQQRRTAVSQKLGSSSQRVREENKKIISDEKKQQQLKLFPSLQKRGMDITLKKPPLSHFFRAFPEFLLRPIAWVSQSCTVLAALRRSWQFELHDAPPHKNNNQLIGELRTGKRNLEDLIQQYQNLDIDEIVEKGAYACEVALVAMDLCDPLEVDSSTAVCVAEHGYLTLSRTLPSICTRSAYWKAVGAAIESVLQKQEMISSSSSSSSGCLDIEYVEVDVKRLLHYTDPVRHSMLYRGFPKKYVPPSQRRVAIDVSKPMRSKTTGHMLYAVSVAASPDQFWEKPSKYKLFDFAPQIPGSVMRVGRMFVRSQRFGFVDEPFVAAMYRTSFFSVSHLRGGWDSMRTSEIFASGSVIAIVDMSRCDNQCLPLLPHSLLEKIYRTTPLAAAIPFLPVIDDEDPNKVLDYRSLSKKPFQPAAKCKSASYNQSAINPLWWNNNGKVDLVTVYASWKRFADCKLDPSQLMCYVGRVAEALLDMYLNCTSDRVQIKREYLDALKKLADRIKEIPNDQIPYLDSMPEERTALLAATDFEIERVSMLDDRTLEFPADKLDVLKQLRSKYDSIARAGRSWHSAVDMRYLLAENHHAWYDLAVNRYNMKDRPRFPMSLLTPKNLQEYAMLSNEQHEFAKQHLTCDAVVARILNVMGIPEPKNLLLMQGVGPDVLGVTIYCGVAELGLHYSSNIEDWGNGQTRPPWERDPEVTADRVFAASSDATFSWESYLKQRSFHKGTYNLGYFFGGRFDPAPRRLTNDQIKKSLDRGEFDAVIYGHFPWNCDVFEHLKKIYYKLDADKRPKIGLMMGNDRYTVKEGNDWKVMFPEIPREVVMFSREMSAMPDFFE